MEGIEKEISDQKFDRYSGADNANNYTVANELTVTITLNEYRALVKTSATTQEKIDAANQDKYTREQTIKTLNENITALKVENAELKTQLYEFQKAELERDDHEDGQI